jgi:hypothetical protein
MRTFLNRALPCVLLSVLSLSVARGQDPLPQDLRTETLLVLLYDEVPNASHATMRKHNNDVARINGKILESMKAYQYPYATATRSQFERKEDVPAHKYVIDSGVMRRFNNAEPIGVGIEGLRGDIIITDTRSEMTYVLADLVPPPAHLTMKFAVDTIHKRLKKGK